MAIRMSITIPNRINQVMSQNKSEGSGIIFDKNGYIMTNYHVVEYADPKNSYSKYTTLEVFLPDGRQAKGKFIGGDRKTDLAVIKVDLSDLPVAELGDSSSIEVGELAVAIGNPLGLDFAGSVTAGIISAVNRKVQIDDRTLNLIQTDAAINPGNSGGALVNSKGQVIGINTVKISSTGLEGLGFAIPINDAKPIIDQLVMFGYVKGRPFIGISGREITETIAKMYNIPQGVYIIGVTPNTGAYKAGIQAGDILIKLAGQEIKSLKDVDAVKSRYKAGDTVDAVIYRNGKKIALKLTFSEEK
ncbi:S1C family serine protease [Caloramator sp. Dgby_cultured_2]|uniref:S1C family serine protease n=1 Tax=Caloramator sp. Dgby_cultured_2 TaxID=3029174 RepID=UPI00237DC59B|nr:trypsin-like peptidase domain-containing protein [Caloramator sp. Dgby_cultured_2]WDU83127.1 trypsin-like peptidase domain-containing protein [Caloramator sp. Dgby_cultured_2]